MSWIIRDTDVSETGLIAEAASYVRQVYASARAAGQKAEGAWHSTAKALGISPRRVRSYVADSVTSLPAHEYLTIRQRLRAWVEADILKHEARIAHLRAQLNEGGE